MSSGNSNVFERLWKLMTSACQLVLEGKRDPEELVTMLQKFVFGAVVPNINWGKVYEVLGMEAEYAEFMKANPAKDDSWLWVVPVLKGVTCNKVAAAMKKLGVNFYLYIDDLDKEVTTNDRDPSGGSYNIAFRRNIEADEENDSKSAKELAAVGHKGITLLERLLLELGYFVAVNKNLDTENVTLCTGSRSSDGRVPSVGWHSGHRRVYVCWYHPGHSDDGLRSRSVVFLPA